jgi:hypothetical protein
MTGANSQQSPLVAMMPARNAAQFLEVAVRSVQTRRPEERMPDHRWRQWTTRPLLLSKS